MAFEFPHVVGLVALALTLFNTLHGMVIRRLTTDADVQRKYNDLHERMMLFETRSKPMWDHMERRLAEILHQPDHHEMDRLLEQVMRDPESLSEAQLQALINRAHERYLEVRRGGKYEDPVQELAITLMVGSLNGRLAEMRRQREHQDRPAKSLWSLEGMIDWLQARTRDWIAALWR